jgi:uncharacterized protein (DUF1697 family)
MTRTEIALLRGINVGKAKRIAMADLRALVEELGYGEVRTLLNSGNVVFDVPAKVRGDSAARIEKAIEAELGVSSRVTVISADDLAAAIDANPLREAKADPPRFLVAFLQRSADRALLAPLAKSKWGKEKLALGEHVAYLWCADGILESPLLKEIGRAMKDGVTTRNWATATKLLALAKRAD